MTSKEPDLKTLIRRLEKRHEKKQSATALIAGTSVLGVLALVGPLFIPAKTEVVSAITEAPAPATVPASKAFEGVVLEGKAAIVYDLTTGDTLYEKNSRSQLPLASITKLLTVYAAVEALKPQSLVTFTEQSLLPEGDNGFSVGEQFAFADLARLALVSSSNDATAAIAESAALARATTGKNLLAGAASAAGLSQTYALNGTGLDESASVSGGYGSARDVAILAGKLLERAPDIAKATTEGSISITSRAGAQHTLKNTNQNILHVSNALLSKTGFTDLAGGNLVIAYDAGVNRPVAIVVLGSSREGRFTDVQRLLTRTTEHFAGTRPIQ